MRMLPVVLSFCAGACATAAVSSRGAQPTPSRTTAEVAPLVVPIEQAEQRRAPNGKAMVTILARGHNAFVARLEMDPGAGVPEHRDPTEEYVHILQGRGVMTIDGQRFPVEPGTTVYMPADALVEFANGNEPLVALQVFAGPEPARKYDAWSPMQRETDPRPAP